MEHDQPGPLARRSDLPIDVTPQLSYGQAMTRALD